MITNTPDVFPTCKYELRDVARALDIHKTTVLRYARAGLLPYSIRKTNGRRVWSGAVILKFWRLNC